MAQQPGFILPPEQKGHPYPAPGYPPQPSYPPQATYPSQPPYNPHQPPTNYEQGHQPFPAPIQNQPGGFGGQQSMSQWFANSDYQSHLYEATSFHVKQKVELLEAIVGWESPNKFTIKDQNGNKVFFAGEESGCFGRQLCGKRRQLRMAVKDKRGLDVLIFDRDLDCSCFCGLICPDKMIVSAAGGQKLGSVCEDFHIINPSFTLKDASDRAILRLEGPACPMSFGACGGDVVFRLMTLDGVSVGTISKQWGGLVRELFTDADYFAISFPQNLDPSMKAVCLGALFLIDMEYFESTHGGNQGGRRLFG